MLCTTFLLFSSTLYLIKPAQAQSQDQGSSPYIASWPHEYPGMPTSDYNAEWQNYFQVTENLPNVTWPLSRSWAGNIPVQREGHPNNTLFFWGVESSNGSFTANSDSPWGIWIHGGPGVSAIFALLFENGPIQVAGDYSLSQNQYSWSNITDMVWVDQPCGTGYSTVDSDAYVVDEEQVAADFMGFLDNFTKVFPNLASRPLYIFGESYVGVFLPYITAAYFQANKPPVNLAGIGIGDGAIGSLEVYQELNVLSLLETYPQVIGYDKKVYGYFREQSELCGYNLTLQYPQPEPFPSLNAPMPGPSSQGSLAARSELTRRSLMTDLQIRHAARVEQRDRSMLGHHQQVRARDIWKRDLAGRANGTIDPHYLCDIYQEMIDYAVNYTYPWDSFPKIPISAAGGQFNNYDIPNALNPEVSMDGNIFMNDPRTRKALHAPTSKNFSWYYPAVFADSNLTTNGYGDPSVEPMAFLSELATNVTARGMKIVIWSANDDSFVPHFGSEIVIQNTTFGGIQGFTRKPSTPWYDDNGKFAGIVHQERNWTFVLVDHAGHLLGNTNPESAFVLAREFIFGNNQTGLVGSLDCDVEEVPSFKNDILPGQPGIFLGAGTTASSYLYPSATVKAWDKFIATAAPIRVIESGDH